MLEASFCPPLLSPSKDFVNDNKVYHSFDEELSHLFTSHLRGWGRPLAVCSRQGRKAMSLVNKPPLPYFNINDTSLKGVWIVRISYTVAWLTHRLFKKGVKTYKIWRNSCQVKLIYSFRRCNQATNFSFSVI